VWPDMIALTIREHSARSLLHRRPYVPNRTVRPRFTPPERSSFKPTPPSGASNLLIFQDSNNRTKMGVVRLPRRKWAEREENGPKWGYRGVLVVRTIYQEWPHSAGFRPLIRGGKRMSRLARLAEGSSLAANTLFQDRQPPTAPSSAATSASDRLARRGGNQRVHSRRSYADRSSASPNP
jgi:hypothetical protein